MQWRILERMTFHQDHVKNLQILDLQGFKDQNRYPVVLPYKHCQLQLGSLQQLKEENKAAAPDEGKIKLSNVYIDKNSFFKSEEPLALNPILVKPQMVEEKSHGD